MRKFFIICALMVAFHSLLFLAAGVALQWDTQKLLTILCIGACALAYVFKR